MNYRDYFILGFIKTAKELKPFSELSDKEQTELNRGWGNLVEALPAGVVTTSLIHKMLKGGPPSGKHTAAVLGTLAIGGLSRGYRQAKKDFDAGVERKGPFYKEHAPLANLTYNYRMKKLKEEEED